MKKQQITTCQQDKRVRHGGDIYRNPVRYDFSINLNPLGMPGRGETEVERNRGGLGTLSGSAV